ncbi:Retrovirus-related Pol polyprotein from transposon TNT 1-94 [Eumeta japonica]|uniref:Retrovirus-related Pol polyprotein from transposon TNT 1-94 n=1 Tax=Eumeta variegata TaxID=151549 RepID=A0A4C1UFC7_EUMVA|nr:Retrovirus-related Pol polyprotein from transposon TNT 1-94 [Eumeta japonica]
MTNYLKQCGIVHQKTNSYTPEQNGLCEGYNRSLVEKARCLLYDAQFEKFLWAEADNIAVFIKNRTPAAGLDQNTTPFEIWTGRKPNLSQLKIFASQVMVHIPKEKRRKWNKKAKKMLLVGYSENVKGYRLYDPTSHNVIVDRDVVVMENTDYSLTTSIAIDEKNQLDRAADVASPSNSDEENSNDKTYVPDNSSSDTSSH